MLVTFTRSIILYIIILVIMRLMGKREIGQLQPFELVVSIMIADLASIPMTDTGIPIHNGIVPILGLLLMQLIISIINMKSIKIRELTSGKPRIIISSRYSFIPKISKTGLSISENNGFLKRIGPKAEYLDDFL